MAPVYEVRIFSAAGVEQHRISDYLPVSATAGAGRAGLMTVDLDGGHRALADLEHRGHIELWHRDGNEILWHRMWGGTVLGQEWNYTGSARVQLTALGYNAILSTRIVNWPEGTADRSTFASQSAETIGKLLARYNAGADATVANGRKREGTISGITVEADGARGNEVAWECFGANLLETLQKLGSVGGGHFDLVKTGTNTFDFRWGCYHQLNTAGTISYEANTDRSATVIFAMGNGNMGNPHSVYDRTAEKTAACVWGPGEGAGRQYATREGADYAAGNDAEVYVDARSATADEMETRGDQKLDEERAREEFTFDVIETPACKFQKHFFLGDLVTVRNPFNGVDTVKRVEAWTFSIDETGQPEYSFDLVTP